MDLFQQRMERRNTKQAEAGEYVVFSQKITLVTYEQFSNYEFIPPANFFIRDATGMYVFIHTSQRGTAQAWVDREYGAGYYTVTASKLQKAKGDVTVRGTATRKGQKKY